MMLWSVGVGIDSCPAGLLQPINISKGRRIPQRRMAFMDVDIREGNIDLDHLLEKVCPGLGG